MNNSRRFLPLAMQKKHGLFFRIPTRAQELLKNPSFKGSLPIFGEIRMNENESFDEFYVKLKDIVRIR